MKDCRVKPDNDNYVKRDNDNYVIPTLDAGIFIRIITGDKHEL